MESSKRYIALLLRIIVAFMFLLSAVAKMYPDPSPYFTITTFEMKQLVPLGFSEGISVYLSRILIGAEFALGILLLQRHYLKRFVVPATVLLLVVFSVHLIVTIVQTGNSGNCGCFGELLPMTPLQSVIKNTVLIGLLIWLFALLPVRYDKNNFWVLTTVLFASVLMVFMIAPIQPKTESRFEMINTDRDTTVFEQQTDTLTPTDTIAESQVPTLLQPDGTADTQQESKPSVVASNGPAQKTSAYSKYFADADKGKKIIALFVPGCEHCRDAAKELTELRNKNKDFPEVKIIFMDEEANLIPDFFEYAGAKYPYKVIDIPTFWKVLGMTKDTPGVVYLWNGNIVKEWEGINENQFNPDALMKALK